MTLISDKVNQLTNEWNTPSWYNLAPNSMWANLYDYGQQLQSIGNDVYQNLGAQAWADYNNFIAGHVGASGGAGGGYNGSTGNYTYNENNPLTNIGQGIGNLLTGWGTGLFGVGAGTAAAGVGLGLIVPIIGAYIVYKMVK